MELLKECRCEDQTVVRTSLDLSIKLRPYEGDLCSSPTEHKILVGKLNVLTHTRPVTAFSVQHSEPVMKQPRIPHYQAAIAYTCIEISQRAANSWHMYYSTCLS